MEVGVRELKARLSEYLRQVSGGLTITVTDRGHPVAILSPPLAEFDMEAAVAAGWITPARRRGLGPARPVKGIATIADVLAEDRDE